MKPVNVTFIALTLALLLACSDASTTQMAEAPAPDPISLEASSAPQAVTPQPPQDSVVFLKDAGTSTPVQAPPAQTAPGMNPPHGQPNHRCDIPVGAPLNSPPGKTAEPPAANPSVTQQNVPVQTTAVQTAPGMNPPHGQPNHRCDIPVGAPLDSPPGKTATPPVAPPPPPPAERP